MNIECGPQTVRYVPVLEDVRFERLTDFTLAFHRLSGETHILSSDVQTILAQLPAEGASAVEVLSRLQKKFDQVEAEDADTFDVIRQRLDELSALDIVRRRP